MREPWHGSRTTAVVPAALDVEGVAGATLPRACIPTVPRDVTQPHVTNRNPPRGRTYRVLLNTAHPNTILFREEPTVTSITTT